MHCCRFTFFRRLIVLRWTSGVNFAAAILYSCSYFFIIASFCWSGSTGCKHSIYWRSLLHPSCNSCSKRKESGKKMEEKTKIKIRSGKLWDNMVWKRWCCVCVSHQTRKNYMQTEFHPISLSLSPSIALAFPGKWCCHAIIRRIVRCACGQTRQRSYTFFPVSSN